MKGYISNKYCIYLDQFAVSNLYDGNPEWGEISELLWEGVNRGKLVCPISFEHLLETSGKSIDNAIGQNEYFFTLSDGLCFKAEPYITAQLLISDVRKNNITQNTFLTSKLNKSFSYRDSMADFKDKMEKFGSMIGESTLGINELRKSVRPMQTTLSSPAEQIIKVHQSIIAGQIVERLDELIRGGIIIRGVKFSSLEVPHWIDLILDILMKINKMAANEAIKIRERIQKNGFEHISTLNVRTTLIGYSASKSKKETKNDHIDILRIATSIQVADIMFVDKAKKFELTETGLDKKYNTRLFSGTKDDLCSFKILLKKILGMP
ncbi:MAG: hypothetical protein WC716_11805 [Chitinophagaceae bacterium]|jgi:hypothetical protein